MSIFNQSYETTRLRDYQGSIARNFMSNVFSWMGIALGITALTAYLFGTDAELISLLISETGITTLGWVVTLAPIGLVLLMGLGFNRLSYQALVIVFAIYAILMGMSLSFILLIYTAASIFKTFLVASLMFGLMAIVGYTTKTDLTKFGSILYMFLIGIVVASLVNFFMNSATLDYFISFIGVLVFTGLTAYDVQKLKRIGAGIEYQGAEMNKLTIMGALSLYLDFINLFLFLLRFLGDRK
jgi:FtsH-binding integral membrane protein